MAYLVEGGDEAGQAYDTTVSEQLGHLRNTSDVLFSVAVAEAEVAVETMTDVISIQTVGRDALAHQILLQSKGNGRLTGSRQS